jgi:signal transduction histidine kinase
VDRPRLSRPEVFLGGWNLQNKLLLMLVSLLVLSSSSLFLLHVRNEKRLLSEVLDYTAELSAAIEIAQEQPLTGDPTAALGAYVKRLRQLGVKDVSITDQWEEVQVSTNPGRVGKKLVHQKHKEWLIRGVLGDDGPQAQRTSTLTIPLVVEDRRVGYLVITRILDDFSALSRQALASSLAALGIVFGLGIPVSLFLSHSFARPVERLSKAAHAVAAGDLTVELPVDGGREGRSLAESFNEMVHRLRDRKKLEERLYFAERTAALGRMASAVAHEIRNPLNFINLSIDYLRERIRLGDGSRREEIETTLHTMKQEIARLNRLVADFLTVGRPLELHRSSCRLEDIVRQVSLLVEHKAKDQGVTVALALPEPLPPLVGDPELLKTCLLNLTINSLDAMPAGGRLELSLRPGESHETLELRVLDDGKGMTAEELAKAFEPYFSTKSTGVGLGLSLTRQILTEHGGTIDVTSAPGSGTLVVVSLPCVGADEATEQAQEAVAP